jgi:hypothetical protein
MNYGVEIYIDRERIRLTEELLRPLAASTGTTLYGMHYPAPLDVSFPFMKTSLKRVTRSLGDYSYAKASHDLVITTIPFDLWPFCISGRLDVKHRSGVLERVLAVFKEYGLNIIHLRCTRSGHRFSTISFVAHILGFGVPMNEEAKKFLHPKVLERRGALRYSWHPIDGGEAEEPHDLRLPNEESFYEDLVAYAHELAREAVIIKTCLLRRLGSEELIKYLELPDSMNAKDGDGDSGGKLKDLLYHERSTSLEGLLHWASEFDRTPVGIWSLKNLVYFYAFLMNGNTRHTVTRFKATVADERSIIFKDAEKLATLTKLDLDLPSVGFASLDTDAHLIRLAILSPPHLESFRAVDIDFRFIASDKRKSSIGALHDLAKAAAKDWNIWRVYNRGGRYEPGRYGRPGFSRGRISLIMEYHFSNRDSAVPSDEELRVQIQRSIGLDFEEFELMEPIRIRRFTSRKIFISIKGDSQLERCSEVLEICKEIGSDFGFLPDNVRTVENFGVNSISEEVARTIEDSSGLIQFLMSDDPQSSFTWLETELFHATTKGLPTIRIIDSRLQTETRFFQDKAAIFLPEFASNTRFRAAIKKAFQNIVDRISDTGLPRRQ